MRAHAHNLTASGAQAVCGTAKGAGARATARSRMGAAPARAEHVGDACAHRKDCCAKSEYACAAGIAHPGRACLGGRAMNVSASPALALKFSPWRSRLLLVVILGWLVGLIVRAVYLQGLHNDFLQAKGESRYSRVLSLGATRGMIVDRNNEPLAISTPVESVAASPADTEMTAPQLTRLSRMLEMDEAEVRRRLADTKRDF